MKLGHWCKSHKEWAAFRKCGSTIVPSRQLPNFMFTCHGLMPVYRLALCLNSVIKKRVLLRALLSDCETSIFPEVLVSSSSSDPHPTAGWRWARPRGWWRRWCWSSCSAGTPSPGPSWTAAGSRDASTRPAQYSTVQYITVQYSTLAEIVNVYLRSFDTLNNAGEVQKTFLPHEELLIPLNLREWLWNYGQWHTFSISFRYTASALLRFLFVSDICCTVTQFYLQEIFV